METVDIPESRRQVVAIKRHKHRRETDVRKKRKLEEYVKREEQARIDSLLEDSGDLLEEEKNHDEEITTTAKHQPGPSQRKTVHNTKGIRNIALATIRHHTGLKEAEEIPTTSWADAVVITKKDFQLVIDHKNENATVKGTA